MCIRDRSGGGPQGIQKAVHAFAGCSKLLCWGSRRGSRGGPQGVWRGSRWGFGGGPASASAAREFTATSLRAASRIRRSSPARPSRRMTADTTEAETEAAGSEGSLPGGAPPGEPITSQGREYAWRGSQSLPSLAPTGCWRSESTTLPCPESTLPCPESTLRCPESTLRCPESTLRCWRSDPAAASSPGTPSLTPPPSSPIIPGACHRDCDRNCHSATIAGAGAGATAAAAAAAATPRTPRLGLDDADVIIKPLSSRSTA
eukprot:965356-Prorocentrum_minimum.AAC.1